MSLLLLLTKIPLLQPLAGHKWNNQQLLLRNKILNILCNNQTNIVRQIIWQWYLTLFYSYVIFCFYFQYILLFLFYSKWSQWKLTPHWANGRGGIKTPSSLKSLSASLSTLSRAGGDCEPGLLSSAWLLEPPPLLMSVSSDSDEQTGAAVLIAVTRGSGNREDTCSIGLMSTAAVTVVVIGGGRL